MRTKSLLSAAVGSVAVNGLNNGLGRVPQMGYNRFVKLLVNTPDAHEMQSSVHLQHLCSLGYRLFVDALRSWYDVLMNPSDDLTRATAQAMVDTGLAAAGYKYVNLDDGVWATSRDANGNLATDPTTFPNGLKAVADYVHSQGLLFGVYTDRGTETCGGEYQSTFLNVAMRPGRLSPMRDRRLVDRVWLADG